MKLDAILKKTEKKAVKVAPVKRKAGYVSNDRPYDYLADVNPEPSPVKLAVDTLGEEENEKNIRDNIDESLNKNVQSSVNAGEIKKNW